MSAHTKKIGLLVVTIIGVGVGLYLFQVYSAQPSFQLNSDLYPLYSGVVWTKPYSSSFNDAGGVRVDSKPITDITDLSARFQPFDSYYRTKLQIAGWIEDNALAAGGPGSEMIGYRKGSSLIVLSYHTVFKGTQPNQPVQCPCDISFSMFSTDTQH